MRQAVFSGASFDNSVEFGESASISNVHRIGCNAVSFSRRFTPFWRIATAGSDDQVSLWDAASGSRVAYFKGHTSSVQAVAFGPEDAWLVTGSLDGSVRLWLLPEDPGSETVSVSTSETLDCNDSVLSIAVCPGRSWIAAGFKSGGISVWAIGAPESALQAKLVHKLEGHTNGVRAIVWMHNEQYLISGSGAMFGSDNTVRIWGAVDGVCTRILDGKETGTSSINGLAISPDDLFIAIATKDRLVRLVEFSSGVCVRVLRGHSNEVLCVAFSPDGQTVLSGSSDLVIAVWNAGSGIREAVLEGHSDKITCLAVEPRGRQGDSSHLLVLSSSGDSSVRFWRLGLSGRRCEKHLEGHSGHVIRTSMSPAGSSLDLVGSAGVDGAIRLWRTETGECIRVLQPPLGVRELPQCVEFAPKTLRLVSVGYLSGIVRLFDAETGGLVLEFQDNADGKGVMSLAFSPDFDAADVPILLASAGMDKRLRIWSLELGASVSSPPQCLVAAAGHNETINRLAWVHDNRVVTASNDRTLRVWDSSSGQCLHVLEGHSDIVSGLAVSKDRRTVASGSRGLLRDKSVRVWEVQSGQCLMVHSALPDFDQPALIFPDESEIRLFEVVEAGRAAATENYGFVVRDARTGLMLWSSAPRSLVLLGAQVSNIVGASPAVQALLTQRTQ
eukprot:TRINITY_DN5654_c0_g1_i1.p1 TRINITY_DN5654_c0_g1~~TRINITY_DN5654_c0_g1_i1.p1  ORF type:complete len:727 (-),score=120.16 TRINITY_DN5654_c0_g1_i1:21-2030(-)